MNYAENHPARTAFKRKLIETDLGQLYLWLSGSMFGLLPIAAVFLVLIELQNGQPITGQTWGIVIGLIAGGLILRMIFKYLVYRLQSTAGFEFVARERIALGDRLRNVPMGFFHDNSVGDITATVTTDLNFSRTTLCTFLIRLQPAF